MELTAKKLRSHPRLLLLDAVERGETVTIAHRERRSSPVVPVRG